MLQLVEVGFPERHPLRRRAQPKEDPRPPQATFCPYLGLADDRTQTTPAYSCIRGRHHLNREDAFSRPTA